MALASDRGRQARIRQEAGDIVIGRVTALVDEAREHAQTDEQHRREAAGSARAVVDWELAIEIRELVDELLAAFCERWFGLSEAGGHFLRSGFRWATQDAKPTYPGHFMAPSRYTFQPHPNHAVEEIGAAHGLAMRDAMERYIRDANTEIRTLLSDATVSRAVLEAFPAANDVPLAARTIIGAMMGMVPTVDANLRRVIGAWLDEGTLWSLRAQASATPKGELAELVNHAFLDAMQWRAAPDTLWRTASRSFTVAGGTGHSIEVQPGDIVVAGLQSAIHEHFQAGRSEVSPAFGGDRGKPGHPTHACPGYQPAMAMMLGFADALVTLQYQVRPGPGGLLLLLDGKETYTGPDVKIPTSAESTRITTGRGTTKIQRFPRLETGRELPIWVIGDSWLAKDLGIGIFKEFYSLADALQESNFSISLQEAGPGRKLEELVSNVESLRNTLVSPAAMSKAPMKAVILGGGGNDLTKSSMSWMTKEPEKSKHTRLYSMLNPAAKKPSDALTAELGTFLKELSSNYCKILEILTQPHAPDVPILIHGYDYPIPDGTAYLKYAGLGPWLQNVFHARNMTNDEFNRGVMKILIEELNKTISELPDKVDKKIAGRIVHLNFPGTLDTKPPAAYKKYWFNELHPNRDGYLVLAQKVVEALAKRGINVQVEGG